uniref:Uncharacterized protein n=1 Tax=Trichobilharzia regenti TaxID=157069 RepID=A0AA85K5S0_TRIRE|nr:unnamed protein product [Trichobilharzia regenti]
MMRRLMNCFTITIYILVNILVNYKCSAIVCYECDYCPQVDTSTPTKSGCSACLTAGVNHEVSRLCLDRWQGRPDNFPTINYEKCFGNLCNRKNYTSIIENPISCFVCDDCLHRNEAVEYMCGACATRNSSGTINKY